MLAVICSLFFVSKIVLIFGITFLTLGILLLSNNGVSIESYLLSFGEMMNLLTLFALVPILSFPIKLGNYGKEVQIIIQRKINTTGQLYIVSSSVSYFLSSFMNLAALPMTYYAIRPSIDHFVVKNKERFMSRSITHGFAMPLLWTPITPIVGIVIEMMGVSYFSVLPLLISLSIIGLILDWVVAHYLSKRTQSEVFNEMGQVQFEMKTKEVEYVEQEISATIENSEEVGNPIRLVQILLAILLLNFLILIADQTSELGFLFLISILIIPFSLIWSIFLRKEKEFFSNLTEHFRDHLPKMKDQFFLFLSAGFFITAIGTSDVDKIINFWISDMINIIGVQFFLVIVSFIPLVFAFLGLHPAISFVLIVEALNPNLLGLSPVVMTVAMLGGVVPAFLMGPYNATLGVMSNIIGENPFKISKWNTLFTFLYMIMLIVFVQVIQYIL